MGIDLRTGRLPAFKHVFTAGRMLGFNSIRVAFAFDDTWGINSPPVDYTGACKVPTTSAIMKTLQPGQNASTTIKSNTNSLPLLAPPTVPKGICNADWPQNSTYQRFIWVVDYLVSQVRHWHYTLHDDASGPCGVLAIMADPSSCIY